MKRNTSLRIYLALYLLFALQVVIAQQFNLQNDFSDSNSAFKIIGRGDCSIKNGVFTSKESYASFGKVEWKNYVIKFKARATQFADQVQIWAGFRAYNRSDRYVVGLRGGLQNSLYLSRMGYMGTDQFIGLRPLHFEPKPGTWYDIKIEVCGNRIRVFLNNEPIPRMDVVDKNANLAPTGEVTLGGSWIETEFDDLTITSLDDNYLKNIAVKELEFKMEPVEKVNKRISERASYKPLVVNDLNKSRSEISLDGQWLFMPEQELVDVKKASDLSINDNNWHIMSVPNFWNPSRIWLHGESFEGHQKGVSDVYFQQETDRCTNYTFDYTKTKVAWYRQWIELPSDIKSKHVTLNFDAVSKVAEVFINGQLAGSHIGMFGDFEVDGSRLFHAGKNLVAVRVVRDFINKIEDGDKIIDVAVSVPVTNSMIKDIAHGFFKNEPAGIWQPVKMVITEKVKIEDVYIKPTLTGATFDVTIKNHSSNGAIYNLQTKILYKETGSTLYAGNSLMKIELKAGEKEFPLTIGGWTGYMGSWDNREFEGYVAELSYSLRNDLKRIQPAFIRNQRIAWAASHHHRPAGDALYEYSYLFSYRIEIPDGATIIKLPDSRFVRIVAMSVGDEGNAIPLHSPFDDLYRDEEFKKKFEKPENKNALNKKKINV